MDEMTNPGVPQQDQSQNPTTPAPETEGEEKDVETPVEAPATPEAPASEPVSEPNQ